VKCRACDLESSLDDIFCRKCGLRLVENRDWRKKWLSESGEFTASYEDMYTELAERVLVLDEDNMAELDAIILRAAILFFKDKHLKVTLRFLRVRAFDVAQQNHYSETRVEFRERVAKRILEARDEKDWGQQMIVPAFAICVALTTDLYRQKNWKLIDTPATERLVLQRRVARTLMEQRHDLKRWYGIGV